MLRRFVGPLAFCVAVLLTAGACSSDQPEGATTSTSATPADTEAPTTTEGSVVDFPTETIDCPFEGPPGVTVGCSTIIVPENWETGEGEITLIYARIPARSTRPSGQPIVYLEGGPGGHALDTFAYQFDDLWDPLLDDHDLIFFDQRGAGYSVPELSCPDLMDLARQAEDDPGLDPDEIEAEFNRRVGDCTAGFAEQGIDLTQFNTVNSARDANAIRQVLGHEQWNLLGISYGTKLGLEIMRQFPETVRASVLDSVYPPQVDSTRDNTATFLASLDAVTAACAAETACAREGDLKQRLIDAARRLEASPLEVEVLNYLTGESDTVQAQGDTIVQLVATGLYSPFMFTDWPELLTDIEAGGTDALSTFLSLDRTNEPFFTTGMQLVVQCHEEISFADPAEVSAAALDDPFGLYDIAFYSGDPFALCAAVDSGLAEAVSNQAVRSDVPTLVMAGEFDPVTPPAWAVLAAETLTNAQFVLLTGESHGVSPSECGVSLVKAFLADPLTPVDTDCADDGTAAFLDGGAEPVTMVPTTADFGPGPTAVLQPESWTNQNINGLLDSIRQESILDVTELLQFVGPSIVATSIEGFIGDQLDIELDSGREEPIGTATWIVRGGDNGRVAADLYQLQSDGEVRLLLLISAVEERSDLVGQVLRPAAEAFGVG